MASTHPITLTPATSDTLARLGEAYRRDDGAFRSGVFEGVAMPRSLVEQHVSPTDVDVLVDAHLASVDAGAVDLRFTVVDLGPVVMAMPKRGWGPDVVYVGPDSGDLAEAVLRLAPSGERAAELGTGTGFLATLLAGRYRRTWANDLSPSVAQAAAVTLALNAVTPGHTAGICVSDVGSAFRPASFDLVAGNAPWVPSAPGLEADSPELFSDGGPTGIELPRRFLLDAASLLRPGGLAIVLGLDIELQDGHRPMVEALDGLAAEGCATRMLNTPYNGWRPELATSMRHRAPEIRQATHVAAIVARPREPGDRRRSLLVAVDALERRWDARRR